MAGPDRRPPAAVIDRLFAQPWRFEFCQAVRLLEALVRAPKPVGESGNPEMEPIRFRAAPTFGFEGAPVRHVTPPLISLTSSAMETFLRQDGSSVAQADMTISFFGLAGTVGALPLADTERLLRAVQKRDPAMADFLALFENRLIAVYYRARKAQRPAFDPVPPEESALAYYLQAIMGFALPGIAASLPPDVRTSSMLSIAPALSSSLSSRLSVKSWLPCESVSLILPLASIKPLWRFQDTLSASSVCPSRRRITWPLAVMISPLES